MTAEKLLEQMLKDLQEKTVVFTAGQAEVMFKCKPEWAKEYLFHKSWNNTYLNLWVYSEAEHDAQQLLKEQGI
jgi:hypothetical protein